MKKKFKLFCFGFGQVAKYFTENLIKNDFNFDLVTTNTNKTVIKKIKNKKYKYFFFKNNNYDKNDWVTYLSATSVYGDKQGKWVNENTKPNPASQRGKDRLNAENKWLEYFKGIKLPIQIFRLSGIYSIESNAINRIKKGKFKIIKKKNHFFSRIHVEDIAKVLTISLNKINSGSIFNISDDYPCSNEEIGKYAANLIKFPTPKVIKFKDIKSKMLLEFYQDSKKVDNKKMKSFFKYKLKYPTYKEGLKAINNQSI